MSVFTGLNNWFIGRTERQAAKWHQRSESMASSLPTWRTEGRVRLLIRVFVANLAFGIITGVVQIFWFPFIIAWLVFTVVGCISWTMLRIVINTRDVAPADELDEYEAEIVRAWQATAYGYFTMFTLAVAFYMVFLPVLSPAELAHWVYSGGLFTALGIMAIIAMPTIAYATTFGPVPPPDSTDSEPTD